MNKSQLIEEVARSINNEYGKDINERLKVATVVVNRFFSLIKGALRSGDKVEIRGFGSFVTKNYDAYVGRNPKTGDKVQVSPKRLPAFKSGKDLRQRLNNK